MTDTTDDYYERFGDLIDGDKQRAAEADARLVLSYVDHARVLADLTPLAQELADILRREASGERDGDGMWNGFDVLGHALYEMVPQLHRLAELYREAERAQSDTPIPF